jgi:Na+/proline symporter
MMVQRYLACGNQFKSQLALIVSGVLVILQFLLFLLIGLLLFSFYNFYPLNEEIDQINRIFPIFIVQEMPPGVSGLIIAAIFAAAMSSLSSSLNSLSSSTLNDFYRARSRTDSSDLHYLRVSRIMTIGWGVILILISMLARTWGEVLEAGLTITSFTMGSLLGVFLIGQTQRAVSQFNVIAGMITGLVVMGIIHQFTSLAWTWYVLVGTMVTTAVCLIGSKGSLSKVGD